ncbi:MAG: cupin domain-containing protein [Angelakisella sp.]|nr:cupin domain-containing protein [Angelakisella sp.]
MEVRLMEVAERIRALREILDITAEEMARACKMTEEDYLALEEGSSDFSFSFLLKCAEVLGVDMVELITGEAPKLSFYSIIRKNKGLPIQRRQGFSYQHLAYLFKDKQCEPFLVTAPYREEEQGKPIALSRHSGQEFDFILSGSLKFAFEDHIEILGPGDCVYYDSAHGHGMIAAGGEECTFLAVVLKKDDED